MKQINIKIKGYEIDPDIFELGFETSNPSNCQGLCCRSGVWLSLSEKSKILENKDIIKKFMDETQTQDESLWFENNIHEDKDFPEGLCDSTALYNDKCVFLNKDFKCTLQLAAVESGFDKFKFKPYFCITYPVVICENVITYDDYLFDIAPCCTVKKTNNPDFIEQCQTEFLHILGKDGYIKLLEIAKGTKNENTGK